MSAAGREALDEQLEELYRDPEYLEWLKAVEANRQKEEKQKRTEERRVGKECRDRGGRYE